MERVLVTGHGGQLGTELVRVFSTDYKVLGTSNMPSFSGEDVRQLDITDRQSVAKTLSDFKPDVVVHAAAFTGVDQCERERALAKKVNVEGTKNLLDACRRGSKFVYISTDFVFDGKKGYYKEEDETNPVNYYGRTKLDGEVYVMSSGLDCMIARTSVIYSANKSTFNFARWVAQELRKGNEISAADDNYTSPTLASNLACAILESCEKGLSGIYHAAGSERISRYDFALRISEALGIDSSLVKPVPMKDLNLLARRPEDSSLDVSKLGKSINTRLLNIKSGISEIKEKL